MQIIDVVRAKAIVGVITVPPDASIADLVALMGEHDLGAVVVSSDGAQVEGIVSERDVVRNLRTTPDLMQRPVAEIMTVQVQVCSPTDRLSQLARQMTDHRVRHVPVIDDGRLVGLVSIGDVVKTRIEQLEFERDQLGQYVAQA